MKDLTVLRAKPNPVGKDRLGQYAPNTQLVGEWVDVKNTSGKNLRMSGVKVYDHTFNNTCGDQGKRLIYTFPVYTLKAGHVVRIHSGDKVPVSSLPYIDREGADAHAFTSYSYVWNNSCGDTAEIRTSSDGLVDHASYGSNPVEGKILKRVENTHSLI